MTKPLDVAVEAVRKTMVDAGYFAIIPKDVAQAAGIAMVDALPDDIYAQFHAIGYRTVPSQWAATMRTELKQRLGLTE